MECHKIDFCCFPLGRDTPPENLTNGYPKMMEHGKGIKMASFGVSMLNSGVYFFDINHKLGDSVAFCFGGCKRILFKDSALIG